MRFALRRGEPFFTEPSLPLNLAYKDWDVALLKARPFANYVWTPQCLAANPTRGERVWFVGRNKDWWIPPDLRAGVIEEEPLVGDNELFVQIDSVLPGTSGAPLFSANGIVGMIVRDSPENVAVINIESIQEVVVKRWNYPWDLQPFSAATPQPDPTPKPTVQPTATPTPRSPARGDVWTEPETSMEFVWIEGDCFKMGSPDSESGRDSDEGPVHEVCLDGFWMGKYEVTNAQYRKWKQDHDSKNYDGHSLNGDDQPAVYVSWEDAKKFAEWLGTGFRLPTEAEWEYAARANTTTSRFWGNDPDDACQYANVADQTAKKEWSSWTIHNCPDGYAVTSPVGSFRSNNFGLYDMLGNVWEWCEDVYVSDAYKNHARSNPVVSSGGSNRGLRGGGWGTGQRYVRSANRGYDAPSGRDSDVGLRLVRKK